MADKKTPFSNDKFFKQSLSNPRVAKPFLERYLPDDIKNKVNLDILEVQNASFIENNTGSAHADVLMKAEFGKEIGYLYLLLEQQTKPDPFMPFRLLKYIVLIWDDHINKKHQRKPKKALPLPPVVPLVLYNGKTKYNAPLDLYSLVSHPDIMAKVFNEEHLFVDLKLEDDTKITSSDWLRAMISLMKHAYDPDILITLKGMKHIIPNISEKDPSYMKTLLWYTLTNTETKHKQETIEFLTSAANENLRREIMTIADWLREEGMQQGMQKGKQEGIQEGILLGEQKGMQKGRQEGMQRGRQESQRQIAMRMLQKGMDLKTISEVTGIPQSEIKKQN